jgi:hypothetical protein
MFLNKRRPQNLTGARDQVERADITRSYTLPGPSDVFVACNTHAMPTTHGSRAINISDVYRLFGASKDDRLNVPIGGFRLMSDLQATAVEGRFWG